MDRSTEAPYLLSVGSLLQTSTSNAFVWGTGLIHPDAGVGQVAAANVLAVRGKLTYTELVRNGVRVRDVPLGDPGTLFARMLAARYAAAPRAKTPRFALELVPYVFDRAHPFFVAAARDPQVKVLNVCAPVETFFADLASCDAVASSSLHGLIFGEAFGLPTLWIEVSNEVVGSPFKFADWFSLSDNPQHAPVRIDAPASPRAIAARCEPRPSAMDDAAFVQALTADVIDACSGPAASPLMIPVSECRRRRLPVFLVSYNCAASLRRTAAALRRQSAHVEIVVYDDGSDERATLHILEVLRGAGATVYTRDGRHGATRIGRLNDAIRLFFSTWCEPSRYAVADCSARPAPHVPKRIGLYDDVLDAYRAADSTGPAAGRSTRDRDAQVVRVTPQSGGGTRRAGNMACTAVMLEGGIDVGFSVYRAGTRLAERMPSLRVAGGEGGIRTLDTM